MCSAITSQNGTAPKRRLSNLGRTTSAITSQNGTAPKPGFGVPATDAVRLPVRTALLQNSVAYLYDSYGCDYQSERHCSKTLAGAKRMPVSAITSQNGTAPKHNVKFDLGALGAITSQNGTAPKPSVSQFSCGIVRLPVRTALLQN